MPIQNTKGLDALRALSEGGTPALQSYKAAQGNEASSRTAALQRALGTQDVGKAVADAQAKYAPKVDTSGQGVGDLSTAANSFLTQSANKLAAQTYEDQERLKLQTETLARNSVSEKDRQLMLQGAADVMGQQQQAQAAADVDNWAKPATTLGTIEQQRGAAMRELEAANQLLSSIKGPVQGPALGGVAGTAEAGAAQLPALIAERDALMANASAAAGSPIADAFAAKINDLNTAIQGANTGVMQGPGLAGPVGSPEETARRVAEAQARQQAAQAALVMVDQNALQGIGQASGVTRGGDSKGLLDAYKIAQNTGDFSQFRALSEALGQEAKQAAAGKLADKTKEINTGTQGRLRELAPAFGINELKAAGMFREGEGTDLKQQNQLEAEEAYRTGKETPKQQSERYAADLGFPSAKEYAQVQGRTGLNNEQVAQAMQSDDFKGLAKVYTQWNLTGGDTDDFKSKVREYVNGLKKPANVDDAAWDTQKSRLIEMGMAYYKDPSKTTEEE